MKNLLNKMTTLLFITLLFSCEGGGDKNNPSGEDDGSGAVYARMGIEEARDLDYQPTDFHLSQVGKILFTDNINLNPEEASSDDFKSNFKSGELIKGVAYLDKTAAQQFGQDAFPILTYKVGNKKHKDKIESYRNFDQALSFLEFFIYVPKDQYIPTKAGSPTIANSMETLSKLSNKEYQLQAELLKANGSKTAIKGEITYDATNKKSTAELASEIQEIRVAQISSIPPPEPKMNDSEIEDQLVVHFNEMGWDEHFTKTIILSDEFRYRKSYAGIIVAKTLSVAMVSKRKDGFCMYQIFTVIADKTDDGYSKFKRFSTGEQYGCSCE